MDQADILHQKAIPNHGLTTISQDNSTKTKIIIHKTIKSLQIMRNNEINSKMSTKHIYNIIINENNPDKPIRVIMWGKVFAKHLYFELENFTCLLLT